MGKFGSERAEEFYGLSLDGGYDECCGDVQESGLWACCFDSERVILTEDSQGFVDLEEFVCSEKEEAQADKEPEILRRKPIAIGGGSPPPLKDREREDANDQQLQAGKDHRKASFSKIETGLFRLADASRHSGGDDHRIEEQEGRKRFDFDLFSDQQGLAGLPDRNSRLQ